MREEDSIQKTIVQGLRVCLPHGWIVVHVPNGMASSRLQGAIFKGLGMLPGFPDLLVLGCTDEPRPAAWLIEVKALKGSIKPEQRELHDRLQDLGFPVAIVRSWEDVVDLAREWNWPWRARA